MNRILAGLTLALVAVLLAGCTTMQEIKPPQSGSDQAKATRFEYMQNQWSYLNNGWIKGQRVYPEGLEGLYKISKEQAKSEIKEFVVLHRNHCGFRRFILSIYANHFSYYVD